MNSIETEGEFKSPQRENTGRLAKGILAGLTLTIFLCILAICQQFYGIGLTTRHEIHPDRIQHLTGCHRWKFSEHYRSPLMARRASFFQNGELWTNQSRANRDLPALGPGWYHFVDGGLNFVPKNPGDPKDPAVRYSVITPVQFKPRLWWILGGLLLAQLFLYHRFRDHHSPPGIMKPHGIVVGSDPDTSWRGEVFIFICSLIAIFTSLHSNQDLTDHAFMVKGIPESDALAWYEMSVGLSEGHGLRGGFQNQRPFYSIYLSGIFTLFGIKLSFAQGFNALCLALSASGIYTLGRLLHSRWLGLVLATSAMTAATHLDYIHAIISENGGNLLAVLSLLTVWQAAWTLSPRWSIIAGLLNGLAALTSGVTLFTLPFYALILTAFPLARRVHWRKALQLGALYTLTASLLVGSWMIRQKIVNDRLTLSFNTAEVLAGGADLEHGRLGTEIFEQAREQGVDLENANARYAYFMDLFIRTVKEHPGAYLRQLGHAFITSIDELPSRVTGFQLTLLLGLFGFGLWPALIRGQWLALPIAGLLMTLWVRSEFEITPAMLAAAAYLSWRRSRNPAVRLTVALLIATVLATMVLAALAGNVATKRFWLVSDWAAFALLLYGTKHLVVTTAALAHRLLGRTGLPFWITGSPAMPPSSSAAMTPPPFIAGSALTWLAVTVLCSGATLARQFQKPPSKLGPLHHLDLSASSADFIPDIAGLPPSRLFIQLASLGDLHATLHAGEGTQHWMQIYAQRPYARWVAKLAILDKNGQRTSYLNSIGQGSLTTVPKRTPLIVVGVFTDSINRLSHDPVKLFEVIRIIPLKQSGPGAPWEPDTENQINFSPTPEALAAAGSASPAP